MLVQKWEAILRYGQCLALQPLAPQAVEVLPSGGDSGLERQDRCRIAALKAEKMR